MGTLRLILYSVVVCVAALGGFLVRDYTAQPVVQYVQVPVDRIVTQTVIKEVIVEKAVEKIVEIEKPVERIVEKVIYVPYKRHSDNTISVMEALTIIEEGRRSHYLWATRPDLIALQDEKTGNTQHNLMWAKRYEDIGDLIKELAGEY